MKKNIAMLLAGFIMFIGLLALAPSANATDTFTPSTTGNKTVEICHYVKDVQGKPRYEKTTISIVDFYGGHRFHNKDIWKSFKYRSKFGHDITVPGQGDASRLAFENCQIPDDDEKIAKPSVVFNDVCGTEDDVFSVAPGTGYTVGDRKVLADKQTITVTANKGFVFNDGSKSVTFEKPLFTNEDCDLPETGGEAQHYVIGGIVALVALGAAGYIAVRAGRKGRNLQN